MKNILSAAFLAAALLLTAPAFAGGFSQPGVQVSDDPLVWTGFNTFDGRMSVGTDEVFGSADTTPDVSTGSLWTSNATGVTITDFDGTPVDGQLLYVRSGGATVYDCTASNLDCGSIDITTASGDMTVWMYDGTDWDLLNFTDVSTDMGGYLALSGGTLTGDLTMGSGAQISLDDGSAAAPVIMRTDKAAAIAGGLYWTTIGSTDALTYSSNGSAKWVFNGLFFESSIAGAARLMGELATPTNPTLVPYRTDTDTGVGGNGSDQLSLTAGAIEGMRIEEASSQILLKYSVHAGLTASTTQTQGQGALLSSYNEIATVANANDTVTLPTAAAGYRVVIVNNGANTLRIFPASGDNLGAGADTATTLAAGSNVTYLAYDATNWESI